MILPGCKHTEGPYHDCKYVDARTALIPKASQIADRIFHPSHPDWTIAFHAAMERLTTGRLTDTSELASDVISRRAEIRRARGDRRLEADA